MRVASLAGNIGVLLGHLGREAEAREHLERHRILAREMGDRRGEAFALHNTGTLDAARDEVDVAAKQYEGALAIRRDLGEKAPLAMTLSYFGELEAARGDPQAAARLIDEARTLAADTGDPETMLIAEVHRARLPGASPAAALALLDEIDEEIGHAEAIEIRFRLWELTMDRPHLVEAHRLLDHLRAHAPEQDRDSMVENVPLHRALMLAWESD